MLLKAIFITIKVNISKYATCKIPFFEKIKNKLFICNYNYIVNFFKKYFQRIKQQTFSVYKLYFVKSKKTIILI